MAISKVKLALKATTFLQPAQVQDSDFSRPYNRQQQTEQPKILNQVNCVALAHGIKSATVGTSSIVADVLDESGNSAVLSLGPSTELTTVIDQNGNLWYMLLDRASGAVFTTDVYLRAVENGQQFAKYCTITTTTRYEYNVSTVFQNKTLFAGLPAVVYHQSSQSIAHFDAVVPAIGQFFDVDLTTQTIRRFDLIGIGADVYDSIQCVTSYQNYMLLFTRNRLYYSCPTDPFDFIPVDAGGGSTAIAEVRGDILAVLPSDSGFIVYCRDNIVLGRFTGSTVQPFTFTEIKGSSGLIMRGEEALLVKNETSKIHFAVLVGGLSMVTENEVQTLNPLITRFVSNNFTETRVPNSGKLLQVNYSEIAYKDSKIKRMYSFGSKLFMLIETAATLDNMVYIYDTADDSIGIIHGDYIALTTELTQADASSNLVLQRKVSAITDSFVLLRDTGNGTVAFDVLDLGTKSDNVLADGATESEILIGDISLGTDNGTIVESIELFGRLEQYVEGEAGFDPTGADRVRVYGYSEWYSEESLLEFEYNPLDNRYYGSIEGPNVRLLIVGKHFYLTGAEIRAEAGIIT